MHGCWLAHTLATAPTAAHTILPLTGGTTWAVTLWQHYCLDLDLDLVHFACHSIFRVKGHTITLLHSIFLATNHTTTLLPAANLAGTLWNTAASILTTSTPSEGGLTTEVALTDGVGVIKFVAALTRQGREADAARSHQPPPSPRLPHRVLSLQTPLG